jgi:F0F1-type ATP synthase assembly protein I
VKSQKFAVFIGIGFELVGIILVCIYLGKATDDYFGTKGIGLALMPIVGLIGWIVQIVILTKKLEKNEEDPKN